MSRRLVRNRAPERSTLDRAVRMDAKRVLDLETKEQELQELRAEWGNVIAFMARLPSRDLLPVATERFADWTNRIRPALDKWARETDDSSYFMLDRPPAPPAPALPITEQRQPVYGHPALNFARQAIMWSGLLGNKLTSPISSQEVAIMMAACKLARLVETPTHEDSILDVGGYMACLEQVNAVAAAGTDGTGIRSETVAQARALRKD